MDSTSNAVDSWANLPDSLLLKITENPVDALLSQKTAMVMHLVNKHWRDAIRQCFKVLHPKTSPFNFFGDAKAFCQFPKLHTIHLKNCSFWKEAWGICDQLSDGKRQNEIEMLQTPMADKLVELRTLSTLKLLDVDDLQPFLLPFCRASVLQHLFLRGGYLSTILLHCMKQLKHLKTLSLTNVMVASDTAFLNFLSGTPLEQLTVCHKPLSDLNHAERFEQMHAYERCRMHGGDVGYTLWVKQASQCVIESIVHGRMTGREIKEVRQGNLRFSISDPAVAGEWFLSFASSADIDAKSFPWLPYPEELNGCDVLSYLDHVSRRRAREHRLLPLFYEDYDDVMAAVAEGDDANMIGA